jgi:chromosome partitioning protein
VVDRVVIPVRPGLLDLAAARDTISIVRDAKVNSLLVLSACPSRAPEITLAREHLALTGLPVAQTVVTERRVFSRALQTGRGVHEFEAGKGTDEIEFLLGEVLA